MKFKKVLFNIVVYALLIWSLLMGVYSVLPQEVKDLIPQFNELTALISGGSTMLIGSGGLVFNTWLAKARVEADGKYQDVVEKFLLITEKYNNLESAYSKLEKSYKDGDQKQEQRLKRIEALLETDLKAKLSNKLIEEEVKTMIEGTLNEKKVGL